MNEGAVDVVVEMVVVQGATVLVEAAAMARVGSRHAHRWHSHHRGGVGIYYGAGYYNDGYYGHGDWGWLRKKAIRTGSGYWWRRYEYCID